MRQEFLIKKKRMGLFSVDGLQKQTGVDGYDWHVYIVKELVDNSLDACEDYGIQPSIKVKISHTNELVIRVEDNGPGISKECLEKILDPDVYVGTKYYYRRPTRGAQGNALMTVIAIPLVLGESGVLIATNNRLYEVRLVSDAVYQQTHFELEERGKIDQDGTWIEVRISDPWISWLSSDSYLHLFRSYAAFNPHARFEFEIFGEVYKAEPRGEIRKFTGNEPVHWYSLKDFKELIYAHIRSGKDKTVKEFCLRFKGITRNTRLEIRKGTRLSDLDEESIEELYNHLKDITKPFKPRVLGVLGKETLYQFVVDHASVDGKKWRYRKVEEIIESKGKQIPIVLEVLAAYSQEPLLQLMGINYSPAHSPQQLRKLTQDYLYAEDNVVVVCHISCPNLDYTNYGKTEFDASDIEPYWRKALEFVLKPYLEEREKRWRKEEKQQIKREKARKEAEKKEKRQKKQKIKEVFLSTLDEALKLTSDNGRYVPTVRQVFYKHRPMLQERGVDISYDYYSRLFEKEEERRGERLANREARGVIIHPRSNERINIDTRTVNNYIPPEWEFNKVLYIEKRGFLDYLVQEKVHSRYDIVLVGGQGYSTWDNRALLAKIVSQRNCTIFCLHDADIDGVQIKDNLEKEHYLEGTSVKVIDMGLSPSEAMEKDLPKETQERENKPKKIEKLVSEEELKFFNIRRKSPFSKKWLVDRVELNVFSPGEFVRWVESKLGEFGVTQKVIPPDEVIKDRITAKVREKEKEISIYIDDPELSAKFDEVKGFIYNHERLRNYLKAQFYDFFEIDEREAREYIEEKLKDNPPESWADILEEYTARDLSEKDKEWRKHVSDIKEEFTNKSRLDEVKKLLSQLIQKYENEDVGVESG